MEWANALGLSGSRLTLEEVRLQPTTYLVAPDERDPERLDLQEAIDCWCDDMFEDQLSQWITDESLWPANRTPHLFRDWFDVETSEFVGDLEEDVPLLEDDCVYGVEDAMARCGWCLKEFSEADQPMAVTARLLTDEPLEIPTDVAVPWPVGATHGFALATAPATDIPSDAGGSAATFYVCSESCAQALREDLARQDEEPSH